MPTAIIVPVSNANFDLFRQTIVVRDHSISERDTNISDLRKQTETITERLKVSML